MKLSLLHEATTSGAIAMRPAAVTGAIAMRPAAVNGYKGDRSTNTSTQKLGNKSNGRWYLKFAKTQKSNLNG